VSECIHVFLSTFEPGDRNFTKSFVTVIPLKKTLCHTQISHSMGAVRICKLDERTIKTSRKLLLYSRKVHNFRNTRNVFVDLKIALYGS